MPQLLAIILFLNSFKQNLAIIPQSLAIILILFSTNNFIVNACYTATFHIVLSEQRLHLRYRQIRVLGLHCQQINYNICASTENVSHYYHVQQIGSQYAPHPLLPHANACYYSRIILNSLPLLLFSKLFWHNYLRPTHDCALWYLSQSTNI